MEKVFVAIYEDAEEKVPHRFYHEGQNTVYRTTKKDFVEKLKELGHDPVITLSEADIEGLQNNTFQADNVTEEDIEFLKRSLVKWAWLNPVQGTFLG